MNRKELIKEIVMLEYGEDSSDDENILEKILDSDDDEDIIAKLIPQENNLKKMLNPGDEDIAEFIPEKNDPVQIYSYEIEPRYSDKEFEHNFRISRQLFATLCVRFEQSDIFQKLRPDKRLPATNSMALFLWFAGHDDCTFRELADRFSMSLSTVSRVIDRVSQFLAELSEEVIIWPDEQRKQEICEHFLKKNGFPRAVGAISCTHIVIDPPKEDRDDFINHKGSISICLQAVCDEEGKFIDIFVGIPGSADDNTVFKSSFVYTQLESLCSEYHILGDSAYPCTKNLLTPYKDSRHLTRSQKLYNCRLSACRSIIYHTFKKLKQRFRQLYYCKLRGIQKLCHFIRACCVLHNITNRDTLDVFQSDEEKNFEEVVITYSNAEDTILGKIQRDKVCQELQSMD